MHAPGELIDFGVFRIRAHESSRIFRGDLYLLCFRIPRINVSTMKDE